MPTLAFRRNDRSIDCSEEELEAAILALTMNLGVGALTARAMVQGAVHGGVEARLEIESVEMGRAVASILSGQALLDAWVERGLLAHGIGFDLWELRGMKVCELLGVFSSREPERDPLWIEVKGEGPEWHRLCLDAGVAVWEDLGQHTEEGDCVVVNLGQEWGLLGDEIKEALVESKGSGTSVKLAFASGKMLVMSPLEPGDKESEVVLRLVENPGQME